MPEYTVAENRSLRYSHEPDAVAYEGDTVELDEDVAQPLLADGTLESDENFAAYLKSRRLTDEERGVGVQDIEREEDLGALDPVEVEDAYTNAFGTGGGANASNPTLTPEVIQEAKEAQKEEKEEGGKKAARSRSKRASSQNTTRSTGESGQNATGGSG